MIYRSPYPDIDIPLRPLHEFVLENAGNDWDRPALIDGPSGRTLTYRQLVSAIRRTAHGLVARGLKKGQVVGIFSPNLPEYAVAFFGTAGAGGIASTINPTYTSSELHHQLTDSHARFLVTIPALMDTARAAAKNTAVQELFVFGEAEGATPFASLLSEVDYFPAVACDPKEDVAVMPYSSGTTGFPKGVMLTHFNIVANLAQTERVERVASDEVIIGILPFYHIYGMVVIMSSALHAGATIVTMPRFDLEQFLTLLQAHGVTRGYLVPPIVLALAKHPLVDQYNLSKLRNILSGAAPLPEPVARACVARLGCMLRQGYGLTETSPVTHANPRDREIRITSVGMALPNTEYRVVDLTSHKDMPPGELGEIWIRGPQVMKGYLNNTQATRNMIDDDGWLHSGDIGSADTEGYLYVVDRVKELIKYKGLQIAPAELEAVIQGHPSVADCAVVPSPDEEAGEVPKAFVVLKPGAAATTDDIITFVANRVAPYKKVRRVEFIDAIPKVPSGKILRRQLIERERAAAGRS